MDYRVWLYGIFSFLALIILSDFLIPGNVYTKEIQEIRSERQQYFNAGGNSHVSYEVVTASHQFSVSEQFSDAVGKGKRIEYSVSRIFNEINWYSLIKTDNSEIHSLRQFTGLVIPLLALLAMAIVYFFKKRMEIIIFVLQLLLVLDLIYVIM